MGKFLTIMFIAALCLGAVYFKNNQSKYPIPDADNGYSSEIKLDDYNKLGNVVMGAYSWSVGAFQRIADNPTYQFLVHELPQILGKIGSFIESIYNFIVDVLYKKLFDFFNEIAKLFDWGWW